MSTFNVAVVPGDGIGVEVTAQAVRVLEKVLAGQDLQLTYFDLGADRYLRTGEILTDTDEEALSKHQAILLGAVGDPRVAPGILERGLLLKLRFDFDQYVNLRPSKYYAGVDSPLKAPEGTDMVVVREGTEGLYVGNGGVIRVGTPGEIATEVSMNTALGVERVVRYAFDLAESRERKKLTLVHKTNVLVHAGKLWQRYVNEISAEYPRVEVDYSHIDAATIYLVKDPQRFDVIVTDNLFGDIITDEAGAITGGIGLAASANLNPTGTFPSMFEPVHGSAPDIAGRGIADPIAAIGSVELLLANNGYGEQAARVGAAIEEDMKWRASNGSPQRTTVEVGDAILALLD
ncbi:3-isopropylmalate dehydrogenase [Actinomycetaceae bacterium WB03_NA08]|uniref:3-isopropylmalate dehydrogenase n=1 Tax=Scrofimicrobium canadense TaxID=2652290 RepID=A0A6N7W936_9ACTO|nr:3-isopropylmalate dehydrogenase [Scrofimicrobium canadense]MSS84942.1 3-isopropylmalate dehydrogenase [Scrofimicrobium canadense]